MAVKKISKTKKKTTKSDVEKNTTIVKNKGRKDEEVIQEGSEPVKITNKNSNVNTVGLSIGVTLNLGDFQSLRIDCWGQQDVESPDEREEVLLALTETLQEHLAYVADIMQDEE